MTRTWGSDGPACMSQARKSTSSVCQFLETLEKVAALVKNQMEISLSDIKSIFLVGAFRQSPLF